MFFMFLLANKFATAEIECRFKIGKQTPLWVTFILLAMVLTFASIVLKFAEYKCGIVLLV